MRENRMKQTILTILALLTCFVVLSGCDLMPKGTPYDEITHETFIVLEVSDSSLLLAEIGEDGTAVDTAQYRVPNLFAPNTQIQVNDKVKIEHNGEILESYPMQFSKIYKMEHIDASGIATTIVVD
jgi:hypothetical protein